MGKVTVEELERAISISLDCIMEDTVIVGEDGEPIKFQDELKQELYEALLGLGGYTYEKR